MTALALILLPAGALAAMATSGQSDGPLRCEIRVTPQAGTVALQPIVRTDRPVSGTYRFHVESTGGSGGSNIDQSGTFDAAPGHGATLGSVSLGSDGAGYRATLDVTAGDSSVHCTQRIGGAI